MWRGLVKRLLIIGVLTGVGSWLLATGWLAVDHGRRLDEGAATTEGKVLDTFTEELSKGGQSSTVTVEYIPGKPPSIVRKIDVNGADYRAAQESGKVRVSYLPDDPEVCRITRFATFPYQVLIGLGGLMLFSGLFCLGYFVVKRT